MNFSNMSNVTDYEGYSYNSDETCLGCETGLNHDNGHKCDRTSYYPRCMLSEASYIRKLERRKEEQRRKRRQRRASEKEKQMKKLDNEDCPICLTKAQNNSEYGKPISTKCSHIFHKDCVKNWRRTGKSTCPVCRSNIGQNNRNNIVLSKKASGKKKKKQSKKGVRKVKKQRSQKKKK